MQFQIILLIYAVFMIFCQQFCDRSFNSGISIGFPICSFIPASRHAFRSSSKAFAVMAMIGIFGIFTFQHTNCFCCFQPIHDRHHHIHDDDIILIQPGILKYFKCLFPFFASVMFRCSSSRIAWAISILMTLSSTRSTRFPDRSISCE